jgi:ubiquinone/menaquinone biosynthesis C-methylase UbiE
MNENHAQLCPSPEWALHIQDEVLPSLTQYANLGEVMLELGPGPGAATEWLRHRVKRLVAVESDAEAVATLTRRFRDADVDVEIVAGDATDLDFAAESFDSVGAFTMLHHVPSTALQQRLLAEAYRVLRRGGVFLGSDSLASNDLHHFHAEDTYNPIDPAALLVRLQAVGFTSITLIVDGDLRFVAHKPAGLESKCA